MRGVEQRDHSANEQRRRRDAEEQADLLARGRRADDDIRS